MPYLNHPMQIQCRKSVKRDSSLPASCRATFFQACNCIRRGSTWNKDLSQVHSWMFSKKQNLSPLCARFPQIQATLNAYAEDLIWEKHTSTSKKIHPCPWNKKIKTLIASKSHARIRLLWDPNTKYSVLGIMFSQRAGESATSNTLYSRKRT